MKKILILLIIILTIQQVIAITTNSSDILIDFTIKPSISINNTITIVNPISNDYSKGWIYTLTPEELELLTESVGEKGTKGYEVTIYYDVTVDVEKDKYIKEDQITFKITIINKGYDPDKDGILMYYLLSPSGKIYQAKKELFELIPPTCPEGTYDRYDNTCILEDGNKTAPKEFILIRSITLPPNSETGEWKTYVTYESFVQPLVKVYDSFYVTKKLFNFFGKIITTRTLVVFSTIIFILLFLAFILIVRKRNEEY